MAGILLNVPELRINGKQQSKEATDTYRKYIRKDKWSIKRNDGDLRFLPYLCSDRNIV